MLFEEEAVRKIKRRHKKEDEVDVSDEETEAFIATLFILIKDPILWYDELDLSDEDVATDEDLFVYEFLCNAFKNSGRSIAEAGFLSGVGRAQLF